MGCCGGGGGGTGGGRNRRRSPKKQKGVAVGLIKRQMRRQLAAKLAKEKDK